MGNTFGAALTLTLNDIFKMEKHASSSCFFKATVLASLLMAATAPLAAQIEVVSGGNVGVGTASPGNKFTVEGTGDVAAVGSSSKKFYFAPDTNGVGLFSGAGKTGNGLYADVTNNAFAISTNSTERLRLDSSGRVGIATTAPTAKLQIGVTDAASVNEGIELDRLGAATSKFSMKLISSASGYYRGALEFTPNGGSVTEAISIGNEITGIGGNVGIGTTSPGTRLEVKGDELRVRSSVSKTDTTIRTLFRIVSDDTVGSTGLEMAMSLKGGTAGSRYGQIQAADHGFNWTQLILNPYGGNIGIGTSTPSQKLEVAGSVRATSFISNSTTYADFVFEPGYKLPALSEVEAHIKELGHLPGIPSEAEAKEHGIDLAAMQVKLLQKVEELTLYVIDLKKENTELRRRAERLEQISIP